MDGLPFRIVSDEITWFTGKWKWQTRVAEISNGSTECVGEKT